MIRDVNYWLDYSTENDIWYYNVEGAVTAGIQSWNQESDDPVKANEHEKITEFVTEFINEYKSISVGIIEAFIFQEV